MDDIGLVLALVDFYFFKIIFFLPFTNSCVMFRTTSITQAVPLSARKATGGSSEGIAPFLQLPHFSEAVVKKISRKVI